MKPSLRVSELYLKLEALVNAERAKQLRPPLRPEDPGALLILIRSLIEYLDEEHAKGRDDGKPLVQ